MIKISQILHTEVAELVDRSLTQLVSVLLFLASVFLPVKVQILKSHFNTLIIGDFTPCRWSVEPQILKKQPVRPKQHGFTWSVLHSDILYSPVLDV